MGAGPSADMKSMHSREWDGTGKVAVVTGPTGTGIGYWTSLWLAERGAHVILAGRNKERLAECEANIRAAAKNADGSKKENINIESLICDLGSLSSIEEFSQQFKQKHLPLHILINNAGIMATPYQKTVDGFEVQFGTNHIGHHYLTSLLLPQLKQGAPSRVVNVASFGHRMANMNPKNWDATFRPTEKQYDKWSAYGNAKLGNILHARALNSKYAAEGVTAYSLHPGVVATELGRQGALMRFAYKWGAFAMKTAEEGAGTSVFCATSPTVEKDAGKFFDKCAVGCTSSKGVDDTLALALWDKTEEEIAAWKKNKLQQQAAGAPAGEAAASSSSSSSSDSSAPSSSSAPAQ